MTFPLFDLSGPRALVTGSSQGIGLALAQGLAEHGASVILNGRDGAKLEAAADGLRRAGHEVAVSDFDVTDTDAVKRGVDRIEQTVGPIDILINNAGMQFRSPLEDFPADRWEQLLKTNISSVFYVGQTAASAFFARTIEKNGWPEKVVIDKSGANLVGLQSINWLLLLQGWFWLIEILQVKYLNNMIEQDHRFIKKLTRPMKGFKSFQSASATLDGIEVAHMIRKHQFPSNGQSAFQQFAALAA